MRNTRAMSIVPVGARHASPCYVREEGRGMPRPYETKFRSLSGVEASRLRNACQIGLIWLLFAALTGCVASQSHQQPIDQSTWPLLSPASLGQSHQASQLLHGDYADHNFTLRSIVTVDAKQLTVIGVTSMGLRAFTLKYDGEQLNEERAPQVPEALQAKQLLNDFQLAFWPLAELQKSWRSAGGEVSEPYPGTRRLYRKNVLLAEVHYAADPWSGRVWLRHFDYPYSLFIESSPLEKAQ
jgi:Protein of unknown function (DUF3261)